MKECPKCNTPHSKPGTYCSRSCANSRIFTEESKKKRGETYREWYYSLSDQERQEYNAKKITKDSVAKMKQTIEEKYSNLSFDELSLSKKKLKILKEQENACLHCGLTEWLGKEITFELDHIDGDRNNNNRINLRVLCPNCHSQTPTWRKGWKNYKEA